MNASSSIRSARFKGVFPVVPTTFTESGDLDLPSQKRCIDFMLDAGANGLCILANFSEQFLLSDAEREVLTKTILEHVNGRVPVIVTTTHFSTQVCAQRSLRAQDNWGLGQHAGRYEDLEGFLHRADEVAESLLSARARFLQRLVQGIGGGIGDRISRGENGMISLNDNPGLGLALLPDLHQRADATVRWSK